MRSSAAKIFRAFDDGHWLSLALRIPSEITRQFDLRAGDSVEARLTADGALSIRSKDWSRASFASEIDAARETMSVGTSVMDELRRTARY